jgi:hypothetical protein
MLLKALLGLLFTRSPSILKPYHRPPQGIAKLFRVALVFSSLIFFCLILGFFYAVLTPHLLGIFAVPIAVLAGLVIWVLPESRRAPTSAIAFLTWSFFITLVLWPNYLAIALPGLPWITITRLSGFPLAAILLICLSTSVEFRSLMAKVLSKTSIVWQLLAVFVAIQLLTIGLSKKPLYSMQRFALSQMEWTAMYFAGCYFFLKPRRAEFWSAAMWLMAMLVCAIGFVERHYGHVPWRDHIPSFLKIEDPTVIAMLQGGARSETGIYRVQGTFGTSLGFAEYLALTMPFILHFAFGHYHWFIKTVAASSIPVVLYMVIQTDSRLGVVGCGLALLLYPFCWAALFWWRKRGSLIGPAIVMAYPILFCFAIASTFFVARLRAKFWGNGAQTSSNQSRIEQFKSGFGKILSNPIGHGPGMAGDTLDYHAASGTLTIDSYFLSTILEYGILGFIVYYGMILVSIYYSARYSLLANPRNRDSAFLVPAALSLVNFFVIKSVFAEQENHALVFMMMGMVGALAYRIRAEGRAAAEPSSAIRNVTPPRVTSGARLARRAGSPTPRSSR